MPEQRTIDHRQTTANKLQQTDASPTPVFSTEQEADTARVWINGHEIEPDARFAHLSFRHD